MEQSRTRAVVNPLPVPRDVLELLKPVTWFPPMWAFLCGVVSSGVAVADRHAVEAEVADIAADTETTATSEDNQEGAAS